MKKSNIVIATLVIVAAVAVSLILCNNWPLIVLREITWQLSQVGQAFSDEMFYLSEAINDLI